MTGRKGEPPTNASPPHEPELHRKAGAAVERSANRSPAAARPRDAHDTSSQSPSLGPFTVEQMQGCAVVAASGEIDITVAPGLRHALNVASQAAARVVLDLSLVTFIDSSGIAVVLDAYKHRRLGHQVALCLGGTRPIVRRVLEITHINTMLPTYDTLTEAIAEPV